MKQVGSGEKSILSPGSQWGAILAGIPQNRRFFRTTRRRGWRFSWGFLTERILDIVGGAGSIRVTLSANLQGVPGLVKPMIDATWNAAGFPGSDNCDAKGIWRHPD
jgi:hypothetical protein